MAKRNIRIDYIKLFAVLMMLLGHCIQFGAGADYLTNKLYTSNWAYIYIYSFHMPLFALISGYLFAMTTSKRTLKEIVTNRIQGLIVPILSWQMLISLHGMIRSYIKTGGH